MLVFLLKFSLNDTIMLLNKLELNCWKPTMKSGAQWWYKPCAKKYKAKMLPELHKKLTLRASLSPLSTLLENNIFNYVIWGKRDLFKRYY